MAKKRERTVENPLRTDLVSQVTAPPEERKPFSQPGPSEPVTPPAISSPPPKKWKETTRGGKTMRTIITGEEVTGNDEFRAQLAGLVGCKVAESHITRALWSLARQAGDNIDELSGTAPTLKRPSKGDVIGEAEFEDRLASLILKALKRVKPAGRR